MFPIAFSIIRDQFPRERISITTGIITSMFAAGSVIGLSVGGLIIHEFGWKMTFFTIIPVSLVLVYMIVKFVHVPNANKANTSKDIEESKTTTTKEHVVQNGNKVRQNPKFYTQIDIKGSILLAITIVSFLLSLTYLQTPSSAEDQAVNLPSGQNTINSDSSSPTALIQVAPFLIAGTIALTLFVIQERKSNNPLIDFSVFLRPPILLSNLIIMIVGLSMFMVFQTIPILVQNPEPIGFAENAINTGKIQLPFAIVLLIFGPTSGFIISRLGSIKPIIFGTVLTAAGFLILLTLHSTEIYISIGLAVLSTGLSLASVGAVNVTILSTPVQFTGVTMGISTMLRIVGSSIGPALAAMYMQTNQTSLSIHGIATSLPSSCCFFVIFLNGLLLSVNSNWIWIFVCRKFAKRVT
jgi:MFS family permease